MKRSAFKSRGSVLARTPFVRKKADVEKKRVETKRRERIRRDFRKRLGTAKAREGSKTALRRKLDKEVSITVRSNNPACVLCGESDWQKLTNGHLFKRRYEPTRFDTREGGNCSTLCKSCNGKDNEDHPVYVTWFKQTYGLRAYLDLEKRAKSGRRFEPYELREMLDDLRNRVTTEKRAA